MIFPIPRSFALRVCLLFFLLVFCCPAEGVDAATSNDLDGFLKKVDEQASHVKSFQCRFKQEKHLAVFARPVIFEGSLHVSRPDRLRWEFTKPLPSVLIFNGKKGVRCSGASKPIHFDLAGDPVMRSVAQQLWSWLDGSYLKMKDQYQMRLDGRDVLRLIPLDPVMGRFVEEIVVVFDPDTLQPSRTEINEPGGDRTILFFWDYVINQPQPASIFASCVDGDT